MANRAGKGARLFSHTPVAGPATPASGSIIPRHTATNSIGLPSVWAALPCLMQGSANREPKGCALLESITTNSTGRDDLSDSSTEHSLRNKRVDSHVRELTRTSRHRARRLVGLVDRANATWGLSSPWRRCSSIRRHVCLLCTSSLMQPCSFCAVLQGSFLKNPVLRYHALSALSYA